MKEITWLPPYIEEEHQALIDEAVNALNEYSEILADKIKKHYRLDNISAIKPANEAIDNAERDFKSDPFRVSLIEHISMLKLFYERPRFCIADEAER